MQGFGEKQDSRKQNNKKVYNNFTSQKSEEIANPAQYP